MNVVLNTPTIFFIIIISIIRREERDIETTKYWWVLRENIYVTPFEL